MAGESGFAVSPKYCGVCLRGLPKEATKCLHCGSKNIKEQNVTFGDPIVPSVELCQERPPRLV